MNEFELQTAKLRFYIDQQCMPQHSWNDGWEYWDDLNNAIKELDEYFKKSRILAYTKEKWGAYRADIISMYNGTLKSILQPSVRSEFDWWFHSKTLYKLIQLEDKHPNSNFYLFVSDFADAIYDFIKYKIEPIVNWFLSQVSRVDYFIAHPHLPFYHEFHINKEEYKHPTLYKIDKWIKNHIKFIPIRFIKWVQKKQIQKVNEGFQKVCLKYPHIVHELVTYVDCYEWIKPYDKYILDGEEIHNKHWTKL